MSKNQKIERNMEVSGADGVHVGTVDRVDNGRIRLTKADSGERTTQRPSSLYRPGARRGCRRTERTVVGEWGRGGHDGRRGVWRADLSPLFLIISAMRTETRSFVITRVGFVPEILVWSRRCHGAGHRSSQ